MVWLAPIWLGLLVRILVTLAVGALLWRLLRRRVTSASASVAIGAVLAVGFIWLADIEGASRLVFLGMEIDRRVESAREIVGRLSTLEVQAKGTDASLERTRQEALTATQRLSELIAQRERVERVEALYQRALAGERAAYLDLVSFSDPDQTLVSRAQSLVEQVKVSYIGVTKLKGIELRSPYPGEENLKDHELTTARLLEASSTADQWQIRARAVQLLRGRAEQGVPEALLRLMEEDESLWVAKEALDAFEAITGYDSPDVFGFLAEMPQRWYAEHKEEVAARLEAMPDVAAAPPPPGK